MDDPVTLSGGNLGGQVVEGAGWPEAQEQVFDGLRYRRVEDNLAIYCGAAE